MANALNPGSRIQVYINPSYCIKQQVNLDLAEGTALLESGVDRMLYEARKEYCEVDTTSIRIRLAIFNVVSIGTDLQAGASSEG